MSAASSTLRNKSVHRRLVELPNSIIIMSSIESSCTLLARIAIFAHILLEHFVLYNTSYYSVVYKGVNNVFSLTGGLFLQASRISIDSLLAR